MKAYETIGEVDERGELRAQLPAEVPVGAARVLVLVPQNGAAALENGATHINGDAAAEGDLLSWIERFSVDAGIEDLAHQHDHYLRGTPKRAD